MPRPTLLLLSMVLLVASLLMLPAAAGAYLTPQLFSVHGSCTPPADQKKASALFTKVNKDFVQAKKMVIQGRTACSNARAAVAFEESFWKTSIYMNALHIVAGVNSPEWYHENRVLKSQTSMRTDEDDKKIKVYEDHLVHMTNLFSFQPAGPRKTKLGPESASLACRNAAYDETDQANDIDKRVQEGVSTMKAFGVEKVRYLKPQTGVMLNGRQVYDHVIPADKFCPCPGSQLPLTFTTTHHEALRVLEGTPLVDSNLRVEDLEGYKPKIQIVLCDTFFNDALVQDVDNTRHPDGTEDLGEGGGSLSPTKPNGDIMIRDIDNYRFSATLVIEALLRVLGPEYDDTRQYKFAPQSGADSWWPRGVDDSMWRKAIEQPEAVPWFWPRTTEHMFMLAQMPLSWFKVREGEDVRNSLPEFIVRLCSMSYFTNVIWRRSWMEWAKDTVPQRGIPIEMLQATMSEHMRSGSKAAAARIEAIAEASGPGTSDKEDKGVDGSSNIMDDDGFTNDAQREEYRKLQETLNAMDYEWDGVDLDFEMPDRKF